MNDLILLENELVPVYTTSTGEKVVYGTDLHRKLEVKTDFSTWVKRRFEECDAEEKIDYEVFPISGENSNGGRPKIDYVIILDTAKEMAMLYWLLSLWLRVRKLNKNLTITIEY